MRTRILVSLALVALAALASGCATTETHRAVGAEKTVAAASAPTYSGPRSALVVGKFDNRSTYLRGMFSDSVDRLGGQAKTILLSHLQQTLRFDLMDRDNLEETAREAGLKGQAQMLEGADYAITGAVSEFGRKVTGDTQLFGILGSGKSQVAYSKVTVSVVDVHTSRVVFSAQGAGEYSLDSREVLGFGSESGYDSTLNGKVLDLAIREAVDRLVEGLEQGKWRATK